MNSILTRIALVFAFVAVGFGVNAQSISSNLNGRIGVTAGVEEDFTTTYSGITAPTVILRITLVNPAQAPNIDLSLLNPLNSTYSDLIFDVNGVSASPAVPPSFFTSPLHLKVTFAQAGVYGYNISILNGSTNAVIASSDESVTVAPLSTPPTISSTLPSFSPAITGTTVNYSVSTVANDFANTQVRVFFKLLNPAQVSSINLQYEAPAGSGNFLPLTMNGAGEGYFGPAGGFPLVNASSNFRATATAPGTYTYKMSLYDVATNDTLASATESITVVNQAPTIYSDIAGDTLIVGQQEQYSVFTTPGSYAGTLVKVFFKMDPAQIGNATTEYFEPNPAPGQWVPVNIPTNGEFIFGPSTGFPLQATSSLFRITYTTAGTYNSKMAIVRAAAPNDTMASVDEYVVVRDLILPTISSTLPSFSPALTGTTLDYSVTTVANEYAGTDVRVFFKLADASQVGDITLQYEAGSGSGIYLPLTMNGAGEGSFGPLAGFQLADASSNFKATATAAGTYTYKMSLYDVNTNDTLATATESIVVVDYIEPTIESTLDGQTVNVNTETAFDVNTTAGSELNTLVRGFIKLADASQATDVNLTYDDGTGNFVALTLAANGTASFGPAIGFPLQDASTDFKVIFDAAGTYNYKLYIYEVATNDTLATSTESVIVVDPTPTTPEISSDLDARLDVAVAVEEEFTVTTIKNAAPNTDVRIRITLETPAQGNDINLEFENPQTSNFEQVTFDVNGVANVGPLAGFALADASYEFKVIFTAGGTYKYNLAIVDVDNNTVLANNDEEVFVLDDSNIGENSVLVGNVFPNPTEGIVNIQTKADGVGSLSVFTLTGQKVMTQTINGNIHTVSMETLAAGMYIIKISQNGNDAVVRVVKK